MGFFSKFFNKEKKETLDRGLSATKQGVLSKIARAIAGKKRSMMIFLMTSKRF